MSDPAAAIAGVFAELTQAMSRGDVDAYLKLCARDAAPQVALFEKNARRAQEDGLHFVLREIRTIGDVAETHFDVVDGNRVLERAHLSLTVEPDGWKVRAL